jgi:hypothetical protein
LFSRITITILNLGHLPFFYIKQEILKTSVYLRLQVEPSQLGPINRALSLSPIFAPSEDGDRQSPKRHVLNKRQDGG